MVTKEQCEQALRNLETINLDIVLDELGYEKAEMVSWYGMNDYPTLEKQGDIDVLRELIEEHFKDKQTLKERFKDYKGETPKEDPWGDRYADECSKEELNKWILEGYGIPPIREKDDVD